MKILISEFITGGGLAGEILPDSLAIEGQLMLNAIVNDMSVITDFESDLELEITRDARISTKGLPSTINCHVIKNNYLQELRSLIRQVDAVLPIAPESEGCLESLSNVVLEEKKTLLSSHPKVINLTTSKRSTAEYLAGFNIPVIETRRLALSVNDNDLPPSDAGWIVKSDTGVGCEDVFICMNIGELEFAGSQCDDPIIQPLIKGIPASLSMLCDRGHCVVIGYNEQMISQQKKTIQPQLKYEGSIVNALTRYKEQLDELAVSVCKVLPDLKGYVGMDVIIHDQSVMVVEINPRLTTSYVGLRESIKQNPARLILDIFNNQRLPEMNYSDFKEVTVRV